MGKSTVALFVSLFALAGLAGCLSESAPAAPAAIQSTPPEEIIELVLSIDPHPGGRVDVEAAFSDGATPTSVAWSWGDGTSSSGNPTSHEFTKEGTYQITSESNHPETGLVRATKYLKVSADEDAEPEPVEPEPEAEPPAEEPVEPEPSEPESPPADPEPVAPSPPDWGSPSSRGIRPGVNIATNGAGCTTSFVFTDNWERYFLSTAAHCVAGGDSDDTNGCDAPISPLHSTRSTINLDTGGSTSAPLVYSSWNTMQERGETNGGACAGNDFALLEIEPNDLSRLHPASLHFNAPTGLATSATSSIWGYGASSLKFGFEDVHPKQGTHLGTSNGGWSHLVYLATPGIPGDSGGHIMTSDGKALGIASTVLIAPYPAANHYTDIAKAVQYAEQFGGMNLELVTWDDFNPSLI